MQLRFVFLTVAGLAGPVTTTLAQNANQAAVDTLTKDVALAVFAEIRQPKAQAIYNGLLVCGDGCDPQQVIRSVGSWDQVGEKMLELGTIKNTARFVSLSPAEANAAIRGELNRFYARYKTNASYGKPLNPATQARILAKIDALLPPGNASSTAAPATPAGAPAPSTTSTAEAGTDEVDSAIDPTLYNVSKLERQLNQQKEQQMWTMILCGALGLGLGALLVYLLGSRRLKGQLAELREDNRRLSVELESRRNQAGNRANSSRQPEPTPPAAAPARSDPRSRPVTSSGGGGAKPPTDSRPANPAGRPAAESRPGAPAAGAPVTTLTSTPPPVPEPFGQAYVSPVVPATSTVTPTPQGGAPATQDQITPDRVTPDRVAQDLVTQDQVFYCPPPDPSGQFDANQQTAMLSPESAYRFSVQASQPTVASFRFEAEPGRLARLLTYRNYMIEPACDSENSYSANYTRVLMRRDGEAVLENGVWRVKTKALIRYE